MNMLNLKLFTLIAMFLYLLTSTAGAGSFRTVDDKEIMNMVEEGIHLIKDKGEKAFIDINKKHGRFNKDNLLLYVYDANVTMLAHPKLPGYRGRHLKGTADVSGKKFRDELVNKGLEGGGWTNYTYKDHGDHGLHFKKVYSKSLNHEGKDYIVAAETFVHEQTDKYLNEVKEHGHKNSHEADHH